MFFFLSVLPPVLVPRQTTELPRERPPLPEYTRPENTSFPTQEPTNSPFQLPGKCLNVGFFLNN